MNEESDSENSRNNSRPSSSTRSRQSTSDTDLATAAVLVGQDQPSTSKQGGGVTRRAMTRGGDGYPAGVECYPLHQLLGQGQPTPAADSSGSTQQEQQQHQQQEQQQQQQQEQQQQQRPLQQQQQQQQTYTNEATTISSSINPARGSGGRDELALMKHQNNTKAQQQQQQLLSTNAPPPTAAATTATTTAADPHPSPSRPSSSSCARETPPMSGENHPSSASADNGIDNNYDTWPISLLQRVCARRGIEGMATCRVNDVMAQLLTSLDLKLCRPSPHVDDLQEIALLIPVESRDNGASGTSDEEFSESDQVCDILLPEGVQLEYSGTAPVKSSALAGGTAAAGAAPARVPAAGVAAAAGDRLTPAQRKTAAKQKKKRNLCKKKRELHDKTAQGKKKIAKTETVKGAKEKNALEASAEMYLSKAVSKILPQLAERAPPAGTVWRERTQEAEARSANLALSVKVYEAHKEFSAEMDEIARQKAEWDARGVDVEASGAEKAEGGKGRLAFREKYLKSILKKLEARMLKDADDADI